jgi:hypothetical protein
MTAYNSVRFKVKPGREADFVAFHQKPISPPLKGLRKATLVKTGERSYCFVGEWNAMSDIVAARPQMAKLLDGTRAMLEDLGNGLGVSDPVSGDAVVEMKI